MRDDSRLTQTYGTHNVSGPPVLAHPYSLFCSDLQSPPPRVCVFVTVAEIVEIVSTWKTSDIQ